jgi:hypothetical protein
MNTIVITLDEAANNLAAAVRRLRECGGRAVLMDEGRQLAEITSVESTSSNASENSTTEGANSPEVPRERTGPRVVYSRLTGLPVVTARPGARKVTSEEIYEILRSSIP